MLTGGGASTLNGILNLNGEFDGVTGTGQYTLISASGGSTITGAFVSITGYDVSKVSAMFDAASGVLTVTAVPEPAAYAIPGAAALLVAIARRRLRKVA